MQIVAEMSPELLNRYFALGAAQKCANLAELSKLCKMITNFARKTRLRYGRERALQNLANLGKDVSLASFAKFC